MNIIVVTNQSEFDALPLKFEEYTRIDIKSSTRIIVNKSRENSSVVARENSSVVAWGNSSVEARGNSSVEAWENSSVEAWENSSVEARGNSSVEAWGNSSVVARENSSVVAQDFSMIAVLASTVVINKLLDWSVASLRGVKVKIIKKHKTATVIRTPVSISYTKKSFIDRCEKYDKNSIVLYKSVNPKTLCDFQTGTIKYEGTVMCPDWDSNPERECGGGLHLSPTKGAALSYHQGKVLKCRVMLTDFVVYSGNGTKVRCKKVTVLGDA